MTKQEFHNEFLYAMTMIHVKKMVDEGIITRNEFNEFNSRMKEKYKPVSDGLIIEKDLICIENRANIEMGKGA